MLSWRDEVFWRPVWVTDVLSVTSFTGISCSLTGSWSAVDKHVSVHELWCGWIRLIEVSGGEWDEFGLMHDDGVGFRWSECRPVWVRSRSMESFPVDYRHHFVDDCRTGVANPQVWTVGMRSAVGSVFASVQTGHNWNTWFWNSPGRYASEGGIHDFGPKTTGCLSLVDCRLSVWR